MKNLEIYVVDDRYSVPTLRFAEVRDEAGVGQIAESILSESAHHLSVEVVEGGRTLCVVASSVCREPARHLIDAAQDAPESHELGRSTPEG